MPHGGSQAYLRLGSGVKEKFIDFFVKVCKLVHVCGVEKVFF